jgi:hypothetical protein
MTSHPTSSSLAAAERWHFRQHGYVVTRIRLDPVARQRAIDLVWQLVPAGFRPDDPRTWKGVVEDSCHRKDLHSRRGRLKYRECVRKESWLYDLLAGHPEARAAVGELLGAGEVADPRCFRGLYPVFPLASGSQKVVAGHLDTHPFQVGAVLYLDDVAAGGGGFHVWPGSHVPVALAHRSLHEDDPLPECVGVVRDCQDRGRPVELAGPAGTLILWHQRLVHAAGLNQSGRVRQAMLCDFSRRSLLEFQGEPHGGRLWDHWADVSAEVAAA